ncbi:MAG TPA: hypothetical protein VIK91_22060 [Nannocystis sp.]
MTTPLLPHPLRAVRRVTGAPGLVVVLCALQLALAWALAQPIAAATRATMRNHLWADADRLLAALAELVSAHPAVAATVATAALLSAALGAALALLVRGGVLRRLAGPCSAGEIAQASVAHLPVLALLGLYGLVLRLALAFVAHAVAGTHALAELAVLALLMTFATCAGDLAAYRRVVRGDRCVHPREYLRACLDLLHSPRLWLASAAASLARWAVAAAIVLVAVHGFATAWSPWAARALACLAVVLSLWRAALVVDAGGDARS